MGIICNAKYHNAIRLKFGDTFLTSAIKLALETTASISSTIKEFIFLYYRKFSAIAYSSQNLIYSNNKVRITKKHAFYFRTESLTFQNRHLYMRLIQSHI